MFGLVSFVANRPTQLGLFRKRKSLPGPAVLGDSGHGTGLCKARGRGHVQLELRVVGTGQVWREDRHGERTGMPA